MEHEKVCPICGQRYKTTDPNRMCCSSICGLSYGRNTKKKYYTCQHCSELFWRPNAFRMKYCSKECQQQARRLEAEKRRESSFTEVKTTYHRNCVLCGKAFDTTYPNHIYCCEECGYNGNLRMKRNQWAEAYIPRTFVCKECGHAVETECGNTRSEFCSKKCESKYHERAYKMRRSEQMKIAYRAPVSFNKIYLHYHGICGICGLPVPHDKAPEKLWSATIDHILPLSQGGTHEPENCQLAHRLCNSIKLADTQAFHIDWEEKNQADNGRWSEALKELYDITIEVSMGA